MTRSDLAKLLGGHATGTLTEAERKALYAAALEDQALFDALMDEEALRELLADSEARTKVLAALTAPAPVKPVPFWRRPGILGAAAGVLMASLAGLTWLRSPQTPPPVPEASPATKSPSLPEAAEVPESKAGPQAAPRKAAPRPAPESSAPLPVPAPAAVPEDLARRLEKAAPPPVPSGVPDRVPGGAPGDVVSGVVGGGAGRPPAIAPAPAPAQDQVRKRTLAAAGVTAVVAEVSAPVWQVAHLSGGLAEIVVTAPPGAQVVLLKRGPAGVEVQAGQVSGEQEGRVRWRYLVRLGTKDALDLYLPAPPVADPAALPETGPVGGFRARIFPEGKSSRVP